MGLAQAFREILHSAKDAGASFLVQRAAAHYLEPYGRMLSFSIDSKNSRIRVEIMPKGETQSITIDIDEYQLITEAGAEFIVVKKAKASREWLTALLEDFVIEKPLALPDKYGRMLKTVL